MKKYDPVLIKWRDSVALDGVWVEEVDIDSERECIITTVGVFIEKSKRWVIVCLGWQEGAMIRPFFIPRKAIVEMRVLK